MVNKKRDLTIFSSSGVNSIVRADNPSSKTGLILSKTANSSTASLSFAFAILATRV